MDEKRLAKISTDALDEEAFAYGILIGENNYDGADGARTVRKLCGYIGELLAHIRAQQAQMQEASNVSLDTRARLRRLIEGQWNYPGWDVDQQTALDWLRSLEQKP